MNAPHYVPSALATQAARTTSEKYRFFSTAAIIGTLEHAGYDLHSQTEAHTRKEEMKGFTKHLLRFRRPGDVNARRIGDAVPEIGVVNSHNGGGSLRIYAGLFRLVCLNGMVVGDTWDSSTYPHRGNGHTLDDILEDVFGITEHFTTVTAQVQNMQARTLTQGTREEFARQAALLRWEEGQEPVTPHQLLRSRRLDDRGSDAWSTFNVVQENLIKGQTYYARTGKRKTRAIKGLDSDLNLNRRLWTLGQELLN